MKAAKHEGPVSTDVTIPAGLSSEELVAGAPGSSRSHTLHRAAFPRPLRG